MRSRLAVALAATAVTLTAAIPGTALAATEFGDSCVGDGQAPGDYTLTTLSAPSDVHFTAPVGGVVTKVKMQIAPGAPAAIPTSVKVLRSTGPTNFTVIGETTVSAGSGTTVADARIPIQAGDRLGLHGEPVALEGGPPESVSIYCGGLSDSGLGAVPGNITAGNSADFFAATSGRVPLSAVIEPDADNDGYGDETQDKCPQSGAFHDACPLVVVDARGVVRRAAVTVLVATDFPAPVTVKGTASLGKGKKATLTAPPQTVIPGQLVRFKLKFSAKLKKRLQELEPSKKLTLKITAGATNPAGAVSSDLIKAKLKGQA